MTWNYRILNHGTHYALHEVYYRDGKPASYTAEPVAFVCDPEDGAEGVIASLTMALEAGKRPVLTPADFEGYV